MKLTEQFMRGALVASAVAFGALAPHSAAALDAPVGPVVLSVKGNISETNNGDQADFDTAMLEALGIKEFQTTTIWTEGTKTFEGPTLRTILEAVGAKSDNIRAVALNDYAIEMTAPTVDYPGPVIALRMDGNAMPVRNKGPLWLVYPYDSDPAFRTEVVYANSIWQLRTIEVQED